jgi:ABC-type glycerol-3-phosphate transport system substrate-binding protein
LFDGRVAMAAAWPGGYGQLRTSPLYPRLQPAPYPGGPAARVSYAGAHAWAIPTTCGDVPAAVALVNRLLSADAGALDARGGAVCAHVEAFAAVEPVDATDASRLAITRETIEHAMITYPPLVRFPEVEDAGWGALSAALRGEVGADECVRHIQQAAEEALT